MRRSEKRRAAALGDLWRLGLALGCFGALIAVLARATPLTQTAGAIAITPALLLAAAAYTAAHGLRAIRLALFVGDRTMPLKRIVSMHMLTAGLGMILPWKLSELVRIKELASITNSTARAIAIVVIERGFDFAVAIVLFGLFSSAALASGRALFLVWSGAVVLAFVLFWVMPENLPRLKLFILQRYQGVTAFRLLQAARLFERLGNAGHRALRRDTASAVLLTMCIWLLELATLALAIGTTSIRIAADRLFDVLAAVPGGAVHFVRSVAGPDQPYQILITVTALALGSSLGLAYVAFARADRARALARGTGG